MIRKLLSIILLAALMLPGAAAPASAATQSEIDQAIQDGLAWLAIQQNLTYGYFGSGYYLLANTATAVLAFANEGHFPGGGTAYSTNVEKGLDFIFTRCYKIGINTQWAGNPDSNANGQGILFNHQSYMYETGLVMQAIVASNTPNRVVTTGACAGMTYAQVMTDVVDFIAWAQIDGGPGRGGWRYGYYSNTSTYADNSVSQWPVLGLVAAEQWGINAPPFVKDELEYWVTYIQRSDGGSGYDTPNDGYWNSNPSRTGGLLVEFYYLGDDATTPRVQQAINYVNSHWGDGLSGWNGNKGHPYAMFSIFKGLELLQVPIIPNAPANPETPAGDWWGDYSEYLVNTQTHPGSGLGYWGGYQYWGQYLATPWYIVILQATVFPVSVDVGVPGAACDLTGYEVNVTYSVERFTASGELRVYRDDVLYDTVTLTDFIGSATVTYNLAPETVGDHTWRAELNVTGGGITTQAVDTDNGSVYTTPQVAGIPDQVAPFTSFDLDDFQTCTPPSGGVDWSVSGTPAGWTVSIDADHVVTVTAPDGSYEPAEITFTGIFHWPEIDCEDSDTATFSPNRPPVAHPGKLYPDEKYHVDEGGSILLDGTQSSDPDGDALTYYAWDLDEDGTFEVLGATTTFSAADLDGPSDVYVHLKVCDEHGACSIGTAEVEIENVAPTIDTINAPLDPVNISDPVNVEVFFSDPGVPDTHDVTWNWGDTSSETQSSVTSPVSASHNYAGPGVYEITVTVTDDDGGSDSAVYQYVVVYDPSAGFVTGGGWIDSPPGAYYPAPLPLFDGSYYQLVDAAWISWDDANTAASSMTLMGCSYPHLVTITSQEEQDALYGFFDGALQGKWYGGFQNEGETDPAAGWNWVTGEPWAYTNWALGEPNDASGPGSEPHLIGWSDGWAWNDEGNLGNVTGYVVEYDDCFVPTGKANFGFISKYQKGATIPTGNTEFQFHAAGLNFHSSSYEWLLVTGSNFARFKGVGTINGGGVYNFMLWAGDGDPDTFRIRIWEEDDLGNETVIYDNGMNQAISGGSIVVHTK